jgi:pepF/M3 family oligoendopeptidase
MAMAHLPNWQLETIFPSLDSPDYQKAKQSIERQLKDLESFFDKNGIQSGQTQTVNLKVTTLLNQIIDKFNTVYSDFRDLRTYLYLITSTEAFNHKARAELSSGQPLGVRLAILSTRFTAWLSRFEARKLIVSKKALAHRQALETSLIWAKHLMGPEAEEVANSLAPSSVRAWSKLHDDLISQATIKHNGKDLTLTQVKNLQADPNSKVRQAAFESEIKLLEKNEISFAAALNSIKGQVNELCKRRGWNSALDQALQQNSISRQSLEAMQQACREAFPMFRRYLKAKAKFLGKRKLDWYDLDAPISTGKIKRYSWEASKAFILEYFGHYSETLAAFAQHSFEQNWHHVPPRKGKTNGAYCAEIPGRKESRIMHNFSGSLNDLFTLAHELGHAYHNECMYQGKRTLLQMSTPMTLAETASTFCETIVVNAILDKAKPQEKLAILDQDLQGATGLVVDIFSRFIFESAVFEKRLERELSIDELKTLMLDAQDQTYGDALSKRHELMWAHKGHYYIPETDFYNFPYTFGYLFALGLYAEYQRQPIGFHKRYDTLLSSSGLADAKILAQEFGIDIESVDFWRSSLRVLDARVSEFEKLTRENSRSK